MRYTHSPCRLNLSDIKIIVASLVLLTVLCVITSMRDNFFNTFKDLPSIPPVKVLTNAGETNHAAGETNRTTRQNYTEYSIKDLSAFRVEKVRKYCSNYKKYVVRSYPDYNRIGGGLTNWIWMKSSHHRLFFCATAKCGSTTWKSYLMKDLKIDWHGDLHE